MQWLGAVGWVLVPVVCVLFCLGVWLRRSRHWAVRLPVVGPPGDEPRDTALDALPDAVVTVDADRRVLAYNDAATALFSHPRPDGRALETALPALADALDAGPADTGTPQFECVLDGETRTLRATGPSLASSDGSGRDEPALLVLRDVTDDPPRSPPGDRHSGRLATLHELTRDLAGARTEDEVLAAAVDGVEALLEDATCRVLLAENGRLEPAGVGGADALDRGFTVGVGLLGRAYETGDPVRVDALDETRGATTTSPAATDASETGPQSPASATPGATPESSRPPVRSVLAVPIADVGLVVAVSTAANAFTPEDRDLVEVVTAHVESSLERVTAESTVRRERDRLDEFASIVSHDLRSPLNVAHGRLDMARETLASGQVDTAECHLDAVDDAHERMQSLIENLLALARQGAAIGDVEPVDLGVAARNAWAMVETPDATLSVDAPGVVEGDPSRLADLFGNLFRNAVAHGSATSRAGDAVEDGSERERRGGDSGEGSRTLTVRVEGTQAGFAVEDDGRGVPPDVREHVFEKGFTTDASGTGYGLPIVRRIAEAHGWSVSLTEGTAGGARFEFCLAE